MGARPRRRCRPAILSSTTMAMDRPDLVSGFTLGSVNNSTLPVVRHRAIDQPLDILFALDTVASHPPQGFEGLIDAEHAGVIGYSFDGYNTGPQRGTGRSGVLPRAVPDPTRRHSDRPGSRRSPATRRGWDAFAGHASAGITTSDDGLWQPMTDERIGPSCRWPPRVVALRPAGLAAVDRPILMLAGTRDEALPGERLIFERLRAPKAMISFVVEDHMSTVFEPEMAVRMAHFAVAFFGHHLQGREELAQYYSEAFVARHDDLAWGVHPAE
jgi:hypothetical protein